MLKRILSTLKSVFGNRPARYAGLPTALDRRMFGILPVNLDKRKYEAALIEGLSRSVKQGDRVIVIGGGLGVTAAYAAIQAGADGKVICYEGSSPAIPKIEKTLERNNVRDRVEVVHAIVNSSKGVYGDEHAEEIVPTEALPECDILEMDCEGGEAVILPKLKIQPRAIIVETHGFTGATTEKVAKILNSMGYSAEDLGVAEPYLKKFCLKHDIRVLFALRKDAQ